MVKSHFSFISCADIVPVFQSMFRNSIIERRNGTWRTDGMFFGIWSYLMESVKRKIKNEDRYVLLFDESHSLNQQLKKTAGHPSYIRIKLNLNRKLKGL